MFFRISSVHVNSALGLAYSKNYVNPTKIFVLRSFKMAANQTQRSRLEQDSVIKLFMAKKCKLCEIYTRLCDVYEETYFSRKNLDE